MTERHFIQRRSVFPMRDNELKTPLRPLRPLRPLCEKKGIAHTLTFIGERQSKNASASSVCAVRDNEDLVLSTVCQVGVSLVQYGKL
jgi:hypothetical protein